MATDYSLLMSRLTKKAHAVDARFSRVEADVATKVNELQSRNIAVEEVKREIYNPLPEINTQLNAGI